MSVRPQEKEYTHALVQSALPLQENSLYSSLKDGQQGKSVACMPNKVPATVSTDNAMLSQTQQ